MSDAYPNTELHIAGKWLPAAGGETLDVINPATEDVIGSVAHARIADLDAALAAAESGFRVWKEVSAMERYNVMRKAANLVRERADQIAAMMTMEQGKPLGEAKVETLFGADIIDWFAEEARRAYGWVIPARMGGVTQMVVKEPVGPVAAFTPWNFPINQAVRKLSGAVAAGCSIILKGPEETPASCAALVRAFVDAGLPDGVVNLVYGIPAEISEYLIPHKTIRKVTFTGSTAVGKQLAALAGQHMKRVTMELGGHSPAIVFEDADVEVALQVLTANKFRNAGQVCVAGSRLLVEASIHDDFVADVARISEGMRVGDPLSLETAIGAINSEAQLKQNLGFVDTALAEGGEIVTGGQRILEETGGYFMAPTIVTGVRSDATLAQKEVFGPVLGVTAFDGDAEAVRIANSTVYGLAGAVWTSNLSRAHRMVRNVRTGVMHVNTYGGSDATVPLGGVGQSGNGHDKSLHALEKYINLKTAWIKL